MWFPELIPEFNYLLIGISGILLLIALDIITGIASAIKNKCFQWEQIADFLTYDIFPYVLVWGSFSLIPVALLYWKFPYEEVIYPIIGFSAVAYTFIIATLMKSIWNNIAELGIEKYEPDIPE